MSQDVPPPPNEPEEECWPAGREERRSAAVDRPRLRVAALAAHRAGLCVLPAATDGTKKPDVDWKEYQETRASEEQILRWFEDGLYDGMGVVCGEVSGGLLMVEIEGRFVERVDDIFSAAADAGLDELLDRIAMGFEERSPSGGLHWLMRVTDGPVPGNMKLARRPGPEVNGKPTVDVLIETRGEGGWVVTQPSGGRTHPTGGSWTLEAGGWDTVTEITGDEMEALFDLLRSFDEMPAPAAPRPAAARTTSPGEGKRPGDDFNERGSWQDVLGPHGWTWLWERAGTQYLRRPGKTHGVSATINAVGTDHLKVHTTSTVFDTDSSYDLFGAYCLLEHGGDFEEATKALRAQGYGDPLPDPSRQRALDAAAATTAVSRSGSSAPDFTDEGNAQRLIAAHGERLRHVTVAGKWLVLDGPRWVVDETALVMQAVKQVLDTGLLDEARVQPEGDKRNATLAWRQKCGARSRIEATEVLARTEPGVPVHPDVLDKDPWALNVLNGTIDLRTGELRPHDPSSMHTKLVPVDYDPAATCPRWLEFVWWCAQDDPELVAFLQRAVGYSLTGDVSEQVFLFLHGLGSNGKSTFVKVIQKLLGDYAMTADRDLIVARNGEVHPTGVADLKGKRMVVVSELDDGRVLAEAMIKQLTGGDRLKARYMRQDFFEFDPTHKLWLLANHKPTVRGTDNAIWRRIRLVPFNATVLDDQKDPRLDEKLYAELPGILNWALEGVAGWREHGLGTAAAITAATNAYRDDSDVVGRFVNERCVLGSMLSVQSTELYKAYTEWCVENGERTVSQKKLADRLREHGFTHQKDSSTRHAWWFGLRLAIDYTGLDEDVRAPATHRDPSSHYTRGDLDSEVTREWVAKGRELQETLV